MSTLDVVTVVRGDEGYIELRWHCPGCGESYCIPVAGVPTDRASWVWNHSATAPTLSPSINSTGDRPRCHSFVRDGTVQFLGDCEHELAGQSVRMLPEHADPFAVS